jgi:HEAT repeat protein
MVDATTKKLMRLLEADQPPELRSAAATVLGEVGGRDAELGHALRGLVNDPDPAVRCRAIVALGKLRIDPALPQLLDRVKEGGPDGELAAQAAARLGARGTRALLDLMPEVAPGVRRKIAAALGAAGNPSAESAAIDSLLDSDPGVVEATTRSLIGTIPTLTPGPRKALADQLLQLLSSKKKKLPQASETALVRLVASLNDARAKGPLWERTLPPCPVEVRAAALQALGRWPEAPSRDQLRRLLACAVDADFRIAAPALVMLKAMPATDRSTADWLPLLEAPDVAVRRVALEKVGGRDSAAVAAALLIQIEHPDRGLRDDALNHLTQLKHGREALTRALLTAATPDQAWVLARAEAPFAKAFPTAWREQLFTKTAAALEEGDRRADAWLFLLRTADAAETRDRLENRALALRKKKDYARALIYLRTLARDPACGLSIRLELAACGLKVSRQDLSAEARANDPALEQFARLIHAQPAELSAYIQKASWLTPADLLYLGFHFAEREGAEKKFGGDMLRLVIKRSPRTKVAQNAKSKLRSAGLD